MADSPKKGFLMKVADAPSREPPKHTKAVAWTLISPDIQGNKAVRMMVTEIGPGGTADPNTHPWEHAYFILSGRATAHVEGEEFQLEPGCCLYIAPGALHDTLVTGNEPLRFIVVNGPTVEA